MEHKREGQNLDLPFINNTKSPLANRISTKKNSKPLNKKP